ncbi:MAG: AbrB/MazE/SpoVT family DNA-binding domain-containing protein [Lentisphaerota bacterium]
MTTVLSATSRGQVTLPKSWRDKFDTNYFQAEIQDEQIILRPLKSQKTITESIEDAWQEALAGKVVTHEELLKKYGI